MAGESFSAPKPSWVRRAILIGVIVFHGAAALGLLVYSVFHVEELAPPEVTLTFFNAPPPPPPPPPPAGGGQQKKPQTKPKVVPIKPTGLKEPKPTPKEEPKEESHSGGGEPGGVVGGVAGGVVGGVVGGVLGGVVSSAAPPPPPPAAQKMVPSFVFDKERISAPDPHLPTDFTSKHPKETLNGSYRICVGTDGRISEMSVVRGIPGVDDHIIRQVRGGWVYKPQPLPLCSIRAFVFKIN